jgi:hypothetical protein
LRVGKGNLLGLIRSIAGRRHHLAVFGLYVQLAQQLFGLFYGFIVRGTHHMFTDAAKITPHHLLLGRLPGCLVVYNGKAHSVYPHFGRRFVNVSIAGYALQY